jgi:NACHT domain
VPEQFRSIADHLPSWAVAILAAILFAAVVKGTLSPVLTPLFTLIRWCWRALARHYYGPADLASTFMHKRSRLAGKLIKELAALDSSESWEENRFTELEAEVEITDGRERIFKRWRNSPTRRVSLRRESSLTRALGRSHDPLILLEGEPGSGKSVALRHLATHLADRIIHGDENAEIPLYINLKSFRPRGPLGANAVMEFVMEGVAKLGDTEAERFVREALDGTGFSPQRRGKASWALLLDSFDEIPDILSATGSSLVTMQYATAIRDFINFRDDRIRAVVASREFKGPPGFSGARFRILSLTDRQQQTLIQRAYLDGKEESRVVEGIATAGPEFGSLARNPMFLSLVCEYAKKAGGFPVNVHSVYETYLGFRLDRDMDILGPRYNLSAADLRFYAECAAYSMASANGLGLSPDRQALISEMLNNGAPDRSAAGSALNALVSTKLGRGSDQLGRAGAQIFTFNHRRIQEYFATCVVLRDPSKVPPVQLLTDARWRETAVTILQTQPASTARLLLEEAEAQLRQALGVLSAGPPQGRTLWAADTEHVLGILAQGLGRNPEELGATLRALAGDLITRAWEDSRQENRAMALGYILCGPGATVNAVCAEAFASDSGLLRERAFGQVAWLREPPPALRDGVRLILATMWASPGFWQKRSTVRAQLRRLQQGSTLLKMHALLLSINTADLMLLMVAATLTELALYGSAAWRPVSYLILMVIVAHLGFRLRRDGMANTVLMQSPYAFALRMVRRILPSGRSRRAGGRIIRWTAAVCIEIPLVVSLIQNISGIGFLAAITVIAATAWPDALIDHVVLPRARKPGRNAPPKAKHNADPARVKSHIDWEVVGGAFLFLLWCGFLAAVSTGVPWLISHGWHAAGLPTVRTHRTHTDDIVFACIGIAAGIAIVGALLYGAASAIFRFWRDNRASARAIAEINGRSAPYSGRDIIGTFGVLNSRYSLKAFLESLRSRPQACSADALNVLSDLAASAGMLQNGKQHGENIGSSIPIPNSSCAEYIAWVGTHTQELRRILNWLDQDSIDSIVILAERI